MATNYVNFLFLVFFVSVMNFDLISSMMNATNETLINLDERIISNGTDHGSLVGNQFQVTRCQGTNPCMYDSRPSFTACFNGTSMRNVYCCNPLTLGNKNPNRNQLFKPNICCTASGN